MDNNKQCNACMYLKLLDKGKCNVCKEGRKLKWETEDR